MSLPGRQNDTDCHPRTRYSHKDLRGIVFIKWLSIYYINDSRINALIYGVFTGYFWCICVGVFITHSAVMTTFLPLFFWGVGRPLGRPFSRPFPILPKYQGRLRQNMTQKRAFSGGPGTVKHNGYYFIRKYWLFVYLRPGEVLLQRRWKPV